MRRSSPRQAAEQAPHASLPPGADSDRFAGYGVMGLPFASGDYLALRHWPTTSIGPGYIAVWHRDPTGRWTIYSDAPPERSCARYLGPAVHDTRITAIALSWPDEHQLEVTIGTEIEWTLELAATPATRTMTALSAVTPGWVWRTGWALRLMGASGRPMLRAGKLRLTGTTPTGHRFQAAPRRTWVAARSSARVGGRDLGPPRRLAAQPHLGGVWLPQRGIFYAESTARFWRHQNCDNPAPTTTTKGSP